MNKLTALTTVTILFSTAAYAQNNFVNIEQINSEFGSNIEFEQTGVNNETRLGQGQGRGNNMDVSQDGDSNKINAEQWGAVESRLEIIQDPHSGGNLAGIEQSGINNRTVTYQQGIENTIKMRQGGDSNLVTIEQVYSEVGSSIDLVDQNGMNNEAWLGQGDGQKNSMLVVQGGDTNIIRAEQWGAVESRLEITQDPSSGGNLADIKQSGIDNLVVTYQKGTENTIEMSQDGAGNTATIDQLGSFNRATFSLGGVANTVSVLQY